jgi:hypothetical protein
MSMDIFGFINVLKVGIFLINGRNPNFDKK